LTIQIRFHVWAWIPKSMQRQANFRMDLALYCVFMVDIVMACLKYLSFMIFYDNLTIIIWFHAGAWIHSPKFMQTQVIFYMDFAKYWIDMVCIVMACLKYLSFSFFNDILTIPIWLKCEHGSIDQIPCIDRQISVWILHYTG
jgi:hypothetical protein